MKTERLFFKKLGEMRYISHLDIYRTFQRAIVRSGLDVWYTEGFNAHLYLSFPLALSLGFESDCEIAEIKLLRDEENIAERVNRFLPDGLEVFAAAEAQMDSNDIDAARYFIEIDDNGMSPESLLNYWNDLIAKPAILVKKKTKKGKLKEVDLKEDIKSERAWIEDGMLRIDVTVSAGNQKNLNPNTLLSCMYEMMGREADHWLIKRVQWLTKDGKDFR